MIDAAYKQRRVSGVDHSPGRSFLEFIKVSGKTKFKGGGPGLGLAIARGIILAHRGRIWVESPGYDESTCPGSRFIVTLPLAQRKASVAGSA